MQMKKNDTGTEVQDGKAECIGIHELIDWQIVQYRKAVSAHRIDLSKAEGCCVAWQEAEQDFSTSDRTAMGDKSRVEYCGLICPERKTCLLALHFLHGKRTEPLYRAG